MGERGKLVDAWHALVIFISSSNGNQRRRTRLDVAVDDAARVQVRERVGELPEEPRGVGGLEPARRALKRRERCRLEVLEDEDELAAVAEGVQQRDDRLVAERAQRRHLALGRARDLRVREVRLLEALERHERAEVDVSRAVDRPVRPLPDLHEALVVLG
jgi:hypothetical protein